MPNSNEKTPTDRGFDAITRAANKEKADGLGPSLSDTGFDQMLANAKAEKNVNGEVTVIH